MQKKPLVFPKQKGKGKMSSGKSVGKPISEQKNDTNAVAEVEISTDCPEQEEFTDVMETGEDHLYQEGELAEEGEEDSE